jgi:hypothetical protein
MSMEQSVEEKLVEVTEVLGHNVSQYNRKSQDLISTSKHP